MTDKERLEEIKKNYQEGLSSGDHHVVFLTIDDIDLLIEQAELAQRLEDNAKDLREALGRRQDQVKDLEKEKERYREALEFYADREGTYCKKVSDTWGSATAILQDRGEKARQALEDEIDEG